MNSNHHNRMRKMVRHGGRIVAATLLVAWLCPAAAHAGAERKCKVCHDFTTGKNKFGPSLKGILGRKAGTYPGYRYVFKAYIKGEPWVWDEEKIRQWDFDTAHAVKALTGDSKAETRMPSQFMTGDPEDEIIAYIRKTSGKAASAAQRPEAQKTAAEKPATKKAHDDGQGR